jgi:glutamate 5-kinase
MVTKLKAAQLGTAAGVTVVIMNTQRIELLDSTLGLASEGASEGAAGGASSTAASLSSPVVSAPGSGEGADAGATASSSSSSSPRLGSFAEAGVGTTFLPSSRPVTGRKRWILSLNPEGCIVLDKGAVSAVVDARKSLFPAGVVSVEGTFDAQDAVQILSDDRVEVARALVNYSSEDCRKLKGRKSREIAEVLGYLGAEALCDRDNIVVLHASGAGGGGGAGAGAGAREADLD